MRILFGRREFIAGAAGVWLSGVLPTFAAAMVAASVESSAMYATSPDGCVKCVFAIEDGLPVVDVSFCGKETDGDSPRVTGGSRVVCGTAGGGARASARVLWYNTLVL